MTVGIGFTIPVQNANAPPALNSLVASSNFPTPEWTVIDSVFVVCDSSDLLTVSRSDEVKGTDKSWSKVRLLSAFN